MERAYFDIDSVPSDIWRLLFKRLTTLTDLCSFNSINKSCHNYSKYYMQKQKIWLGLYKERFGLVDETNFIPSILPSKLFHLKQMLRPTLNINNKDIKLDGSLKIVVIGDGGVGKTSFIKLISGEQVNRTYIPNIAYDFQSVTVISNNQIYKLALWDTSGAEKFGGLRDGYYIGAVGAIILSDVTSPFTIKNIPNWIRDIRRVCGDIPTAVCVNKMDAVEKSNPGRILSSAIKVARKHKAMFCEMSNWAKFSVHEPLLWILQQLTGGRDETLKFTFPPLVSDKHAKINPIMMEASITARRKALEYRIEDDFTGEIVLPRQQTDLEFYTKAAQKKREVLASVVQSCSPRVKSVMESLLTGVRTGPALSMLNHHPLQKPSLLFVEGLECNEFHSIDKFNFVQPFLEFYKQHEDAIIMETKNLMSNMGGFDDSTKSIKGSSKSLYLMEAGKTCQKTSSEAPILTQLLQTVTSLMTCSFGYAYISILGPHSHITPHHGPCNIKLRCHLPLIVPSSGCTMRVGTITKSFKQGELLIFDDSLEHEVLNDSDSSRVVLLFDIWHPDLTSNEIKSFNRYFW